MIGEEMMAVGIGCDGAPVTEPPTLQAVVAKDVAKARRVKETARREMFAAPSALG